MFSGGLDSSLIAAIVSEVLDPSLSVDLINVSFAPSTSADRITAIFSFHDIIKLFPNRKLQMLCADYSIDQVLAKENEDFIGKLIYPKSTHMDFNIACALHYASKCEGFFFDTSFYDSEAFTELQAMLNVEAKGDQSSYDFGLVTNKIKEIDPNLYYAKNA